VFTITLPAKLENLQKMMRSVCDSAQIQGFARKKIGEIELAAEEAWVNICNYAYPEQSGDVEVIGKADDNNFIIEIIDSGIPFDITALSDPNITDDVDERKIGGLGVFLMKKMADEVRYRRENDRNVVELIFKKAGGG
jgi:anti-sigma regulatory factor (Ser/Thr protein kinase)